MTSKIYTPYRASLWYGANSNSKVAHKEPRELLKEIEEKEKRIEAMLSEIKKIL